MSLRNVWNEEQRGRLVAQLAATNRAFAAALPAEEAVDGLIINLHLCLTLELSPAEVQGIFSPHIVTFLAGMLAAAHSENVRPHYAIDCLASLSQQQPLVSTQIGVIDAGGNLRPAATAHPDSVDGTVRVIFRGRASGPNI